MKGYYILRINFLNGDEKIIVKSSYNAILRNLENYRYSEKVSYIDCEGYEHQDEEENGWLFTEDVEDYFITINANILQNKLHKVNA